MFYSSICKIQTQYDEAVFDSADYSFSENMVFQEQFFANALRITHRATTEALAMELTIS